ncbi:hypothetical protein KFK09_018020 [Dendrobium nobile]|uniref:Uncharacterized protein n=1 Tax=Dendrobium nobile TaxID=94219 RepID=A0A8T3AVR2_DENNO|nr:hypothetical protein KFK09_018020 [Dendrobium nobile]
MQLKQRLSRLERRKGAECISTDNDEGISDDQISSTPRSIKSSFEIFKDSLPKSSSFPLWDEPIYDVYEDDIFAEVLDLDQPIYNEDTSKVDTPLELVFPLIPYKTTNMLTVIDHEIGMIKLDHNSHLGTFTHSDTKFLEAISVDTYMCIVDPFCVRFNSTREEYRLKELLKMSNVFVNYPICHRLHLLLKFLQDEANDTGWNYPDRFSQPNPPPYCGQPVLFL